MNLPRVGNVPIAVLVGFVIQKLLKCVVRFLIIDHALDRLCIVIISDY